MDYLIKASAVLTIFYIFYKVFLERDTFFQSNRIFLIIGIVSALIIPYIVIPIYYEEVLTSFQNVTYGKNSNTIIEVEQSFDWLQLIKYIYLSGVIFFGIKFIISLGSLLKLIIFGKSEKTDAFQFIKTNNDIAPFSFFNYIVFNPTLFKQDELAQIITHEKVHAHQWHSFDVLLSQTITMVFWFNPFSWLYKKELQQNLEFIADAQSQEQIDCQKTYQKLLLKTSVANNQLELANSFYNSLIKKRIIMLQKNKSKNSNQWKFALILPFLAIFIFTFQTKIVAQKPTVEEIKVKEVHENIEAFIITKDATDLDDIQKKLLEKGVTAKFKNLKRNSKEEITSIKIDLKSEKSNANFSLNSDAPIKPIKITVENNGENLSIGSVSNLHETFFHEKGENVFIIESKDGKHEKHIIKEINTDEEKPHVIEIKEGKNIWVTKEGNKTIEIKTNGDVENHEVIEIREDGDKNHEVIEIKSEGESGSAIFIREDTDGESNLKIKLTGSDEKPLIVIDGKEMPHESMEDLDPKNIESMHVLKGESGINKYGDKAKNGVIEITTKKK